MGVPGVIRSTISARRNINSLLEELYPGNSFNLPEDTLCWAHPEGYIVDPMQMTAKLRSLSQSSGVDVIEGCAELGFDSGAREFVLSVSMAVQGTIE